MKHLFFYLTLVLWLFLFGYIVGDILGARRREREVLLDLASGREIVIEYNHYPVHAWYTVGRVK